MNTNLILLFVCLQIVLIHCYHLNRVQKRHAWSNFDLEPTDEYLSKLYPQEDLFKEMRSLPARLEQSDSHPAGLQKRGRQCLWKVCSWALDKRSLPVASH